LWKINTKIKINIKKNTHGEIHIGWENGDVIFKLTVCLIKAHTHTHTHTHNHTQTHTIRKKVLTFIWNKDLCKGQWEWTVGGNEFFELRKFTEEHSCTRNIFQNVFI
jgi:hypothetical protein